jgi:hypothetical protein
MTLALKPGVIVSFLLLLGFGLEYGLIARSETQVLNQSGLQPAVVRFSWRRAGSEWQTWLVTSLAFLSALAKASWLSLA